MKKNFLPGCIALFFFIFLQEALIAQSPGYSVKGWWGAPPPPFSPVVEKDRSVTFRIKAPHALKIDLLFGEWNVQPQPLKKDTTGVWSVTIPPVKPGIYSYLFSVDGQPVPDLKNPVVKTGTEVYGSIVEVPGDTPRFDEIQKIPYGHLVTVRYFSRVLNTNRSMVVYLPSEYYQNISKRYPVLYLKHGGGDNETSWTQASGRADVILENLIAAKKAVPMIIVMPYGLTDGSWSGGSSKEGMEILEKELISEIMPLVEKSYRTKTDRVSRAIAGLSMGGGQAYVMGLRNTDRFAWIGEFSSGLLSDVDFDINERAPGIFSDVAKLNSQIKLLWISCGTDDPRFEGHTSFAKMLQQKKVKHHVDNVPGGHEWSVWRFELSQFLQRIFR